VLEAALGGQVGTWRRRVGTEGGNSAPKSALGARRRASSSLAHASLSLARASRRLARGALALGERRERAREGS
jgi:hypothetical protein